MRSITFFSELKREPRYRVKQEDSTRYYAPLFGGGLLFTACYLHQLSFLSGDHKRALQALINYLTTADMGEQDYRAQEVLEHLKEYVEII